jgi:CDP-diacylglycerol--glycerol-3-phosphate 3-phosphatidyltransferase
MIFTIKNISKNAFNLPNSLSFLRLLLSLPLYFSLIHLHDNLISRYIVISLILLASITDILDGYFARKFNIVTEFGKIIDPLADKVLVILIVTILYILDEIPDIYFWIIIGRDLIIFCGGYS